MIRSLEFNANAQNAEHGKLLQLKDNYHLAIFFSTIKIITIFQLKILQLCITTIQASNPALLKN